MQQTTTMLMAVGVENTLLTSKRDKKLLFLDIDRFDNLGIVIEQISSFNSYLILETSKGYHVIVFEPLSQSKWFHWLRKLRKYIDQQFYSVALNRKYNVLRISPKLTLNGFTAVPAPKLYMFCATAEFPQTGIYNLYNKMYGLNSSYSYYDPQLSSARFKLHVYYTKG